VGRWSHLHGFEKKKKIKTDPTAVGTTLQLFFSFFFFSRATGFSQPLKRFNTMPLSIDFSASLFAAALVILHLLLVGCLFVYLWLQAPKTRVAPVVSLEERATIRRNMRKND
jgi:hypothetical protein